MTQTADPSNGYDALVAEYSEARSETGRELVRAWAGELAAGASVLELGVGTGEPITAALVEAGCKVSAIDASPRMMDVFRQRFPEIETACEPVETSRFFNRQFDAALAIGLILLLPDQTQERLIHRVREALTSEGRFLFSAPLETGSWKDLITGRTSHSLGENAYRSILKSAGFHSIRSYSDSGGSHYYAARK